MSLLGSFKDDFNRVVNIYGNTEVKSETGFVEEDYGLLYTGIKCLLLKNSNKYSEKIDDKVEILQTSHKIRLDFGVTIKEDNKIIDNLGDVYIIKFVENCPGFGGSDDHLILYADKQKGVE